MNIDLRVIGITGSSTMLLSDTYVFESLFPQCALCCLAANNYVLSGTL
jgi:hypothetical protein